MFWGTNTRLTAGIFLSQTRALAILTLSPFSNQLLTEGNRLCLQAIRTGQHGRSGLQKAGHQRGHGCRRRRQFDPLFRKPMTSFQARNSSVFAGFGVLTLVSKKSVGMVKLTSVARCLEVKTEILTCAAQKLLSTTKRNSKPTGSAPQSSH